MGIPRPGRVAIMRSARILALALVIGWSLANGIQRVGHWWLSDMDAYWNAGLRLRDGLPLYPSVTDPGAADVYRYSPWFAWLWVPLTFLPKAAIGWSWSAILLLASAMAIGPLFARRTAATAATGFLLGSLLLWSASSGNVQPLLIATLAWGVDRGSGPLWVGLAASMKVFPIAYALVYAGRGEWRRAIAALLIAGALWVPALVAGVAHYPVQAADSPNPLAALPWVADVAVLVLLAFLTYRAARGRYGWLVAAGLILASAARLSLIDLTHLVIPARTGAVASPQDHAARG